MPFPTGARSPQELKRDWNALVARSEEPDRPLLLMDGYDALIRRVRTLADHPGLSERVRSVLDELLEYHDDEAMARETAEGYLDSAERHVDAYKALERQAGELGIPVAHLDAWPDWHEAAEMLAATGKVVLANDESYGAYLKAMTIGKARARLTVEQLRSRLRDNRTHAAKSEVQQPMAEPTPRREQGFAHILDDPREASAASREGRAAGPQARQAPPQEPRPKHVIVTRQGLNLAFGTSARHEFALTVINCFLRKPHSLQPTKHLAKTPHPRYRAHCDSPTRVLV